MTQLLHLISHFWLLAHNSSKVLSLIKWSSNAALMSAAICVAVSVELSQHAVPFLLYTVGTVGWLLTGIVIKDHALITLNILFTIINVYGVFERL